VIYLAGPAVLAAALAGLGVYGLLARRNAVMVLVGAELLLAASGLLLVTANQLPAGGLAGLAVPGAAARVGPDPLLGGQTMTIFLITLAAAEIGLALAIVLLLFRARATSDLWAVRELGEASPTYTETPDAGLPGVVLAPRPGEDVGGKGASSSSGTGAGGKVRQGVRS